MLTDVSDVRTASIIRAVMMEAVRTSDTSVNIYLTTLQYIPKGSKFHICRRENLKSRILAYGFVYLLFCLLRAVR
jgi:hypothetical protein